MKNKKTPLNALVICISILLGVFVSVSHTETSEQMAQHIKHLKESNIQVEKDAIAKANKKIASGTITWTEVSKVYNIYMSHKQWEEGMEFSDKIINMKRGVLSYLFNRTYSNTREMAFYYAIAYATNDNNIDRLAKYAEDYRKIYPQGTYANGIPKAIERIIKKEKDAELKVLKAKALAEQKLKDPTGEIKECEDAIAKINPKIGSATIQVTDVYYVKNRCGHSQFKKGMRFFDKVLSMKGGSAEYRKSVYPKIRHLTLHMAISFAKSSKDAARLAKYSSLYLEEFPNTAWANYAIAGMKYATKLKKDRKLKGQSEAVKIAAAEEDIKKNILSRYQNEITVANMGNNRPSDMTMGSNMTKPRITIEWTNKKRTRANVVYDFRSPAFIGKIGHYRELSMKKINGRWQIEKILKDIKSGMGN